MTTQRPDPDRLLDQIKQAEARQQRGRLKIFFGASAGVGKTYAMLSAARQQLLQGLDVLVGVVETHGRVETEVMADGLARLPLKEIEYQGRQLKEFDLDAALIRKPDIILVDELAHTNVSGSRHPKRWQDVEELLAAGIDVYTAINVQHLETLNDVVGGITGIRIWETVPDHVFDAADEVVLVDLPPDELLQRLKDGKVYLPQQAERAIQNFFRKGNLIALRELALRRTADRVDEDMLEYRRTQLTVPVWQTRESLLACVDANEEAERVIRSAARLAAQLEIPWHVIHVETLAEANGTSARQHRALALLKMAEGLGAETANLAALDIPAIIVKYARDHNLSRLMLGRRKKLTGASTLLNRSLFRESFFSRLFFSWRTPLSQRLLTLAPELDITQVSSNVASERHAARETPVPQEKTPWDDYGLTIAACVLTALIATPLYSIFELANIVMLFLLTVVLVAVRFGRGPAVLASFLNVAIFDYVFVQPRFSFAVSDVQYLLTFFVMLMVGLITGQLTAGARAQATVATRREARVRALYEMSRDLSGALMPEQIAEICDRFISTEFSARSAIMLADESDRLNAPISLISKTSNISHSFNVDMGIAQWSFDHAEAAGNGTDTLPGSAQLYIPLKAPMRVRGVLVLETTPQTLLSPEQRRLLDTCARLIGIALERVHYVEVAQSTTVQMESERLRNSLLSAISHDLRTPLSVLIGLAESLPMTQPAPSEEQQEIAQAMREEALRMNSLVNNLLDMARLQAGQVKLNLQWQPLEEVIGSSLKAMRAILRQHQVTTHLSADLPLLSLDAVLIERVLCNLIENAVKYTPIGSQIDISAEFERNTFGDVAMLETSTRYVRIAITDNGPGLPPGKEGQIFEKFTRGQKESTTTGVGLGLAICRAIIEAHGGTIQATNRLNGQGAVFTFTLPCGEPPALDVSVNTEIDEEIGAEIKPSFINENMTATNSVPPNNIPPNVSA